MERDELACPACGGQVEEGVDGFYVCSEEGCDWEGLVPDSVSWEE